MLKQIAVSANIETAYETKLNSLVERAYQTILSSTLSYLKHSEVQKKFCWYAIMADMVY